MQTPKISVVTPSLNQSQFLEETILSVRGQEYPNLEHIIMDGGSTDGTLEILEKYQNTYNLRWISEPDKGQSDAINKGFRIAQGDIIGWVNSDDTYMPGAVIKAVEVFNTRPDIGWVYGNGYWVDSDGRVLCVYQGKPFDYKELVVNGMYFIPQPSLFFRRNLLNNIGFLDENIHTTMDYDFFLRLGLRARAEYIPAIMATRRLHSGAKSIGIITSFYKDVLRALNKLFDTPALPGDIRKFERQAYSKCYLVGGYHYFEGYQYSQARALFWQAIKRDPRPYRKEFYIALVLILESWLKIRVIYPGLSRRDAIKRYYQNYGKVYVNWKGTTEEN
jgi:glycosyltransferase involved in cell wall biosynthesis